MAEDAKDTYIYVFPNLRSGFFFLLRQARGQKRTFDTFTTGVFAAYLSQAMLSYVMLQVTARFYKKFM